MALGQCPGRALGRKDPELGYVRLPEARMQSVEKSPSSEYLRLMEIRTLRIKVYFYVSWFL